VAEPTLTASAHSAHPRRQYATTDDLSQPNTKNGVSQFLPRPTSSASITPLRAIAILVPQRGSYKLSALEIRCTHFN